MDMWKWLASLLASILITGSIAWISFGGGVSAAEGQVLYAADAAITQRQAVLEERLNAQQATLNEVKRDVKEGNAATQGKLDAILFALPRTNPDRHGR
jgi:hypothetical protein